MRFPGHRRPPRGRAVSNIIAAVLLTAITITAGTILWEFHFNFTTAPPRIGYLIRSGITYPVWGDPTDCPSAGKCSLMNATMISFTQHSPTNLPLSQVSFTFICNRTTLVGGSLAAMSWYPGAQSQPPPNAPTLGKCGTFNPHSGSNSVLYNRLGIYVPLTQGSTVIQDGAAFILYIHTPNSVWDPGCGCWDKDDYHGAPPWCFTVPGDCTIYLSFIGVPSALLATIPVYSISGVGG